MAERLRAAQRSPARRPHAALGVVALLIGLFIAGEFVTITVETAPRPPLSSAALQPVLPAGAESSPALTWTNAAPGATGGPSDVRSGRPYLVAACRGGGSITIDLSGSTSIVLDCTGRAVTGPIRLDELHADRVGAIHVERSAGDPRYIVEVRVTATT